MSEPRRPPEHPVAAHERLVAAPGAGRGRSLPVGRLALAGVLVVVVALAGGFALWRVASPAPEYPVDPSFDAVVLAMPADGLARPDGPWVRTRIAPARPGENEIVVWLGGADEAVPTPAASIALAVEPLASEGMATTVATERDGDGRFAARVVPFDAPGWWRITADVALDGAESVAVPFYLVAPDPNVNGFEDVAIPPSDPEAETVYARGLAAQTSLRRVRYWQLIADGRGVAALSDHAIDAGGDGAPPSFTFRAVGGIEAVVIGDRRWVRAPGEAAWEEQEAAPMIPPAEWGAEYAGATGFRLGRVEEVDGEPCRVVTFIVPGRQNPSVAPAWYAWWVGVETGQLRRESMVSRYHYMLNEFRDFDAPLRIVPPVSAASGSQAATPAGA